MTVQIHILVYIYTCTYAHLQRNILLFNFHIHICKGNKHDIYSVILCTASINILLFLFSEYTYKVHIHITVQYVPKNVFHKTIRDLEDAYGIISRKRIDNTISKSKRDRKEQHMVYNSC